MSSSQQGRRESATGPPRQLPPEKPNNNAKLQAQAEEANAGQSGAASQIHGNPSAHQPCNQSSQARLDSGAPSLNPLTSGNTHANSNGNNNNAQHEQTCGACNKKESEHKDKSWKYKCNGACARWFVGECAGFQMPRQRSMIDKGGVGAQCAACTAAGSAARVQQRATTARDGGGAAGTASTRNQFVSVTPTKSTSRAGEGDDDDDDGGGGAASPRGQHRRPAASPRDNDDAATPARGNRRRSHSADELYRASPTTPTTDSMRRSTEEINHELDIMNRQRTHMPMTDEQIRRAVHHIPMGQANIIAVHWAISSKEPPLTSFGYIVKLHQDGGVDIKYVSNSRHLVLDQLYPMPPKHAGSLILSIKLYTPMFIGFPEMTTTTLVTRNRPSRCIFFFSTIVMGTAGVALVVRDLRNGERRAWNVETDPGATGLDEGTEEVYKARYNNTVKINAQLASAIGAVRYVKQNPLPRDMYTVIISSDPEIVPLFTSLRVNNRVVNSTDAKLRQEFSQHWAEVSVHDKIMFASMAHAHGNPAALVAEAARASWQRNSDQDYFPPSLQVASLKGQNYLRDATAAAAMRRAAPTIGVTAFASKVRTVEQFAYCYRYHAHTKVTASMQEGWAGCVRRQLEKALQQGNMFLENRQTRAREGPFESMN
jgi:hypothetical protein